MDDSSNPPVSILSYLYYYVLVFIENPFYMIPLLLFTIFHLWMFVDSVRRQEWIWTLILIIPSFYLSTIFYYLFVFRNDPLNYGFNFSFRLPGADDRARIKELEAEIYNLDKAHHYQKLGDIYLKQGKYTKAEGCFRAALEREPEDEDSLAHLGAALAHQKKIKEALPFLKRAIEKNPRHDYGETAIIYAEVVSALDENQAAQAWKIALGCCSLPRARVQYAELLAKQGRTAEARTIVETIVADAPYTPAFQAVKDRPWVARAKSLLRSKAFQAFH